MDTKVIPDIFNDQEFNKHLDTFMPPMLEIPDDMLKSDFDQPLPSGTPTTKQIIEMETLTMQQIKATTAMLRAKMKGLDKSAYSEKISIRIPTPILALIKAKAKLAGMPYQTYLNQMIAEVAIRPEYH